MVACIGTTRCNTPRPTTYPKYATIDVMMEGYAANVTLFRDITARVGSTAVLDVLGGRLVHFSPPGWRGTSGSCACVADMASQINNCPKGIVTHISLTSDECGEQCPISFDSVTQASTGYVGTCDGKEVHVLLKEVEPMFVHSGIVMGGLGPSIHVSGRFRGAVPCCGHRSAEAAL